ncbi:hypothetical protein HOY82DRAFT_599100 [Tuber indicum]|nr:hypothetical protein HOY82DRAFT_599100 [Tuber indicum]
MRMEAVQILAFVGPADTPRIKPSPIDPLSIILLLTPALPSPAAPPPLPFFPYVKIEGTDTAMKSTKAPGDKWLLGGSVIFTETHPHSQPHIHTMPSLPPPPWQPASTIPGNYRGDDPGISVGMRGADREKERGDDLYVFGREATCTPMRDLGSGDDSEEPLDPSESTQMLVTAFLERTVIQTPPLVIVFRWLLQIPARFMGGEHLDALIVFLGTMRRPIYRASPPYSVHSRTSFLLASALIVSWAPRQGRCLHAGNGQQFQLRIRVAAGACPSELTPRKFGLPRPQAKHVATVPCHS